MKLQALIEHELKQLDEISKGAGAAIGALVGLAVAGRIGAVAGAAVGAGVSKGNKQEQEIANRKKEPEDIQELKTELDYFKQKLKDQEGFIKDIEEKYETKKEKAKSKEQATKYEKEKEKSIGIAKEYIKSHQFEIDRINKALKEKSKK